jgi:hypothetical protein
MIRYCILFPWDEQQIVIYVAFGSRREGILSSTVYDIGSGEGKWRKVLTEEELCDSSDRKIGGLMLQKGKNWGLIRNQIIHTWAGIGHSVPEWNR